MFEISPVNIHEGFYTIVTASTTDPKNCLNFNKLEIKVQYFIHRTNWWKIL